MGFGSYGGNAHGGGSSNLSALAPPFTVDRSIPKPTATQPVDMAEPLNWLDTNPTPYEKPVRQHGTTSSDSLPVMKSLPGIEIRSPAVGACSSEPHYLLNFGIKNEFDPSLHNFLLDGNCHLSGESSTTKTEKLSTSNMASKDVSGNLFGAKSGVCFSHISPDNFSLALDENEAVIAVETSLESLDHYNPPVDSPCWKGAPASYNSPIGSSEPFSVQLLKKLETCDSSNVQAPKFIPMNTNSMVKLPSGKPGEQQPDNAGKAGSYHKKTCSSCEIQFSDDASELKKDYVLFNNSVDEVKKASCTIQQGLAEGRLASKNLCTSETCAADLEMKINDVSCCGPSDLSCHAVENLSHSPSSEEDVSSKHSKFLGKESASKSCTSVLADTLHNLSE
ncbi:hypothetical protein DITRI_Ditri04bG0155300 [Diplodiscus trichospermus]